MDARVASPPCKSTLSMADLDGLASPSTPARIAWDDDRVQDKTSLQVLVDWVTSADNYARWTSGKPAKTELCRELNAQLEAQGIYHRTNRDVYSRLRHLEVSVANAVQYLNEQGLSDRVKLDECSALVKSKVLRSCPQYEVLIGAVEPHLAKISTKKSPLKRTRKSEQEHESEAENSGETDFAEITGEEMPVKSDVRRRSERTNRPSPSGPLHYPTWDLDHTHGKTSMGVLLEWMTNEDNYARWKNVVQRNGDVTYRELCAEVDSLLHAQGITYRSNGSIQKKIWGLEKSMAQAKKLLAENGQPDSRTLEKCKSPVKKKILELCPHFELLAPAMADHGEPTAIAPKASRSKKKESAPKPMAQAKTKRSRAKTSDENDPPGKQPKKQLVKKEAKEPEKRLRPKKRSALQPPVNVRSKRQRVKKDAEQEIPDMVVVPEPETEVNDKESPVKVVKTAKKVSAKLAVKKAVAVTSSPVIATKRSSRALGPLQELELEQQRVRFELEQERTKIELEATRKKSKLEIEKSKIEMTVERALARQKLLSAGIVQAEVDRIFPQ